MVTSRSPIEQLRAHAREIAAKLRAIDEGRLLLPKRPKDTITFGVAMDDKFLKIELKLDFIHEATDQEIADAILEAMLSEPKGTVQ